MLKDEPGQHGLKQETSSAAQSASDLTGGPTDDGADEDLAADEDDMEEEIVGEAAMRLTMLLTSTA